MKTIIKDGHIIDPAQGISAKGDIHIEDGRIAEIRVYDAGRIMHEKRLKEDSKSSGRHIAGILNYGSDVTTINAKGLYVFPGLVDMHTHLREPGYEHKETIHTGTSAAVKGGFTSVCPMPNTNPVNDNTSITAYLLEKALQEGSCAVYPIGAITKGQRGEELAEIGFMRDAGCVAFSDDGKPVMNSLIMRRALEYTKAFDVPIISHCEDIYLSDGGVMNEGLLSTILGLRGIPSESEEVMIARDIILARLTGGRLHIAHVSTAGSVKLIREAKQRGSAITAETCPHYFTVTQDVVEGYNTNAKVNPPLRTQIDVEAIKEGLKDGTIDVIATDHAPHHSDEKLQEFDRAAFGISGLETALSLSLQLVKSGILSMDNLVEKMALNPARILGLFDRKVGGSLQENCEANVVIVDINREWKVDAAHFVSKGKNTPFDGWTLRGVPAITIRKGRIFDFTGSGQNG